MNDPNGLIYLNGIYHMYYQYNPAAPLPGNVHWGYACSTDLVVWNTQPPVLMPDERGLVFSGSMVWDRKNTSGFFSDQTQGGRVAIFTRAGYERQTQDLAYGSIDQAQLTPYEHNPVLDIESDSFRDPKVFWHEPSERWIMVVARSREHIICFYTSPDLKAWTPSGVFRHAGILGQDYECPDLVELPLEEGGCRWVLFVSINPGAPGGGSQVQYFVGHFDGAQFYPEDAATHLLDAGQDFYALQTFSNTSDHVLAMAWMSNWLYCTHTPASPARGCMTLPRQLSLRRQADHWCVVQRFPDLSAHYRSAVHETSWNHATGRLARMDVPEHTALDIRVQGRVSAGARWVVRLGNDMGESLVFGFDQGAYPGFYIDRSQLKGFDHPFWNHKAFQSVLHAFNAFDCHVVIDQGSIEFLGMQGTLSMTLLHFFRDPPRYLEFEVEQGTWLEGGWQVAFVLPQSRVE